METKKICVVGLGYIGLPTAAVLASRGFLIHGVEVNKAARDTINSGKAHVVEPDLDMLVQAGVQCKRLSAFPEPAEADVFMLCVPTPVGPEMGADLSFVRKATLAICPFIRAGNLVILESTSPPGTTEMIADLVQEQTRLTRDDVHFAHAPERVLPGSILYEVVANDRIIGGLTPAATEAAAALYSTFVKGQILKCHCRMAETAKLVENASRDVQIAFANELSMLCDKLDIEVRELIELANRHPRVNILQPGCGVGGHCIAVDPWFLVHKAETELNMSLPLIRTAREVNNLKPKWVVDRVLRMANRFKDPVVVCLGAAYKPNIDDLRESPALEIIHELIATKAARVLVVEPHVKQIVGAELVPLDLAMRQADIIVFLVSHSAFRGIPAEKLAEKIVIDTCGATYSPRLPPSRQ